MPANIQQASPNAAALAPSQEINRLASVGTAFARSAEVSGAFGVAAALARSQEIRRLASVGAALARSAEASGALGVAAALARSQETKRLASVGTAFARLAEVSGAFAAAATLARSKEIKRLASVGTAFARLAEESGAFAAAVALARSQEIKRLASVGMVFARSAEASRAVAISASITDMSDGYRSTIGSALRVSSESTTALRTRPRESSRLYQRDAIRFTRLSNLSKIVHTEDPFSNSVAELFGRELGDANTAELSANTNERDEAAMRAGLNPELIAFPCATYDRVLFSAGFTLSFASVPVPQALESSELDAAFNPQHWQLLNELEQRLRQEIEHRLEKLVGSHWAKQRIPQSVRKRWMDRQDQDRADGRTVYSAIQYADFMDLAAVITRHDNWREAFQAIFRDRDDISMSLRRLHPVRKALAHSRPLGRADVLTLVSEATRIYRALGIRVLH